MRAHELATSPPDGRVMSGKEAFYRNPWFTALPKYVTILLEFSKCLSSLAFPCCFPTGSSGSLEFPGLELLDELQFFLLASSQVAGHLHSDVNTWSRFWGVPWEDMQPTTEIEGHLLVNYRRKYIRFWRSQVCPCVYKLNG